MDLIMPISSGIQAPDFSLTDENDTIHRLSDFRGRLVVLYFYPKDDTPGCTTEACDFRDNFTAFVDEDIVILGVSPDSSLSHAKFKKRYSLPFPLLADEDHKVCDEYGVWGLKKFMGRQYYGVLRTTFLVDTKGCIAKVFTTVKPSEHSAEVLEAARSFK
jgi:thioredoxin-dependent peroxiredoxin